MAQVIKAGDIIKLTTVRPIHWAKNGDMDEFLGKIAEVGYASLPDKDGVQRLTLRSAKSKFGLPWCFLSSDIEGYNQPYKVGDEVVLVEPFKVFRLLPGGRLDICDSEGNCISVEQNQVTLKTTNMKAMKDAVLSTAKTLAKANNTVTTLEIKTELRRDFPYYFWTQDIVSKYMDQLAGDGLFDYTDNGTYRIYRLAGVKSLVSSASKAVVGVKGFFNVTGTSKPKTTAVTSLFGKINGTVATKTSKPIVRTKSRRGGAVNRNIVDIRDLLTKGTFGFATFSGSGQSSVTGYDIKAQKKSVDTYITRRLRNLSTINVAGKTYKVV